MTYALSSRPSGRDLGARGRFGAPTRPRAPHRPIADARVTSRMTDGVRDRRSTPNAQFSASSDRLFTGARASLLTRSKTLKHFFGGNRFDVPSLVLGVTPLAFRGPQPIVLLFGEVVEVLPAHSGNGSRPPPYRGASIDARSPCRESDIVKSLRIERNAADGTTFVFTRSPVERLIQTSWASPLFASVKR